MQPLNLDLESRVVNPNLPLTTMLRREVMRFSAVAIQTVLTPLVTASLYLLIFGVSLGSRVSVIDGFSYAQFVIPGLALMGVIQNSFTNSSSSLFQARYLGFIVDFMVTPLRAWQFVLALTLAAMLRGLIVGSLVLVVGSFFADIPWQSPTTAICVGAIAAFLFAQCGLIAALYSNSFDKLSVFSSFLLLPLIYLGGLFYPVHLLPSPWNGLSKANPVYYLIDAVHYAALGVSETPVVISLIAALIFSVGMFLWVLKEFKTQRRMLISS